MLLFIFEGLLIVFFISQVAIPIARGTKLFPIFRLRHAQKQLASVRTQADELEILSQAQKEEENLHHQETNVKPS